MGTMVSFPGLGLEFTLKRVAFSLFGLDIYWYGILIAFGAMLAVIYAFSKTSEFGLDSDRVIDAILVGTVCAIIGARLYYVIFSAPGEFTSLKDVLDTRRGGVAFYGAVIAAFASAIVVCKIRKIKIRPLADLASIGFLIGQGIGRWGNFINQEAFGSNTSLPWGMTSEPVVNYLIQNQAMLEAHGMKVDPVMPVHPTFLYESLWCILGFLVLTWYIKRRKFDGEIFLMYLAWNGAGRSVIEGLRTDSLYLGSVRISQLLAFVGFIGAVLAILILRKHVNDKRKENPEYAVPYGHTEQCKIDMEALKEERRLKDERKSGRKDLLSEDGEAEEAMLEDEPEKEVTGEDADSEDDGWIDLEQAAEEDEATEEQSVASSVIDSELDAKEKKSDENK